MSCHKQEFIKRQLQIVQGFSWLISWLSFLRILENIMQYIDNFSPPNNLFCNVTFKLADKIPVLTKFYQFPSYICKYQYHHFTKFTLINYVLTEQERLECKVLEYTWVIIHTHFLMNSFFLLNINHKLEILTW